MSHRQKKMVYSSWFGEDNLSHCILAESSMRDWADSIAHEDGLRSQSSLAEGEIYAGSFQLYVHRMSRSHSIGLRHVLCMSIADHGNSPRFVRKALVCFCFPRLAK